MDHTSSQLVPFGIIHRYLQQFKFNTIGCSEDDRIPIGLPKVENNLDVYENNSDTYESYNWCSEGCKFVNTAEKGNLLFYCYSIDN